MDLLFHLPHKVRGKRGLWEARLAWAGHWPLHRTLRGHMQGIVIFFRLFLFLMQLNVTESLVSQDGF